MYKILITIALATSVGWGQVTVDPVNDTVVIGGTASFSITGTGSYQWYRNDTAITGATNNSYSLTATRYMDNDQFYCVANGDTSKYAWLLVINPNIVHVKGILYQSRFELTPDTLIDTIYYDVCYDAALYNKPLITLGHGITQTRADASDDWRERMVNKYEFFVVVIDMRGRGASKGSEDCGAREIHDIIDAIDDAISNYSNRIDNTKLIFYGPSGGGGNALSLVTKFPDYFNFVIDMFGMSDYADWYNETPDYRSIMDGWIGYNPTECANCYSARSQISCAANAYLPKVWIYHDSADPYVGAYHSQDFYDMADDSGLTNISLTITNSTSVNRALHGRPQIDKIPSLIRLEPGWANVVNDTTSAPLSFPDSGWLDIGGYIVTKDFEVLLNTGRGDLAKIYYNKRSGTYKIYNGSTEGSDRVCRLTLHNVDADTIRASVDDYTGVTVQYLPVNLEGEAVITFKLTGTDSAIVNVSARKTGRYVSDYAVFGLLPSCVGPDSPAMVWQGPKNVGDDITAAYESFGDGYGWNPPAIVWQQSGQDSVLTSYRPVMTAGNRFAISMWIKFKVPDAAVRGLFSVNEGASSYLWLYLTGADELTYRVDVDGAGYYKSPNTPHGMGVGWNHVFFAKDSNKIMVNINNQTILNLTNYAYAGELESNLIVGALSNKATTCFGDSIKTFIVYDGMTYKDARYQCQSDYVLGPGLHSYLLNDTLYDSMDINIVAQPIPGTAAARQPMQYTVSTTGDSLLYGWYKNSVYTGDADSVYSFNAGVADNGKYVRCVVWNSADTVWSDSAAINVVYAVYDSVATSDSLTAYFHGNFLSGSGWTGTIGGVALTTGSGSATAQSFISATPLQVKKKQYKITITNGAYTLIKTFGKGSSVVTTGSGRTSASTGVSPF